MTDKARNRMLRLRAVLLVGFAVAFVVAWEVLWYAPPWWAR